MDSIGCRVLTCLDPLPLTFDLLLLCRCERPEPKTFELFHPFQFKLKILYKINYMRMVVKIASVNLQKFSPKILFCWKIRLKKSFFKQFFWTIFSKKIHLRLNISYRGNKRVHENKTVKNITSDYWDLGHFIKTNT